MRRTLIAGTVLILGSSIPAFSADNYEIEQLKQMIQQMKSELEEIKTENKKLKEEIRKLKEGKTTVAKGASFKSKSGKSVDFYGYFKIDAAYSDSKAVGKDYILFALPENGEDNDNDFNLNFRHSRFGFNIKTQEGDYNVLGKFEFDFYGDYSETDNPNKQGIRIRRAFVQVGKDDWSILAGQEWMLIAQLYPHLSNFPSGALMGNIGYRIPQIRVTKLFKGESGTFKAQAAIDQEWGDATAPYWDTGSDSGMPDFQTRFTYDTHLGTIPFHIGVFGHVGREQVDLASGGDKNLDSYSYGAECKIGLSNMFTLSGKIWKGRNVDGWYTGGVGQGVRYEYSGGTYDTKLTGKPVNAEEIDAVGGWIELTARLTNKLTWRIGAGVDNPDNDDLKGVSAARLKNTMYYTNALYKLTPSLGLMGEYLRVETDYPSPLDDGTVNRFQGSILYFF